MPDDRGRQPPLRDLSDQGVMMMMKRVIHEHVRAAALCTFWLGAVATAGAATGTQAGSGSVERARELAQAQLPSSEPAPVRKLRPGEQLGKGNARIGDPVPEAPEDAVSPPADESSAAAAFLPYYYAVTGNNGVSLPSRNFYLCALHKVQGIMEKYALTRVRYHDNNTQEIRNLDGNAAFSSTAACVPKHKFFNNSTDPISQIFDTKYYFAANGSVSYNEEWGNAAAMLTGIGGPFRSLGDRAWVWQEANNVRNRVDIASTSADNIIGYSTAFWFNESSGPQKGIKFIGPGGTGSAALAGEYFVGQGTIGTGSVSMAKASESFCYLTGINGELSSYADRVEIKVHPATNRYVLEVNKSNADAIHAYARCMAFDQR
jgi:hypothetical protein